MHGTSKRSAGGKRKRGEEEEAAHELVLCLVCAENPVEVLQPECGHSVLCVGCAFRIFSDVSTPPSAPTSTSASCEHA